MKDRDVANNYIATELERDRLVGPTRLDCISRIRVTKRLFRFRGARSIQSIILLWRARLVAASHEAFAPDRSRPENGNIRQVLAPDQTVVPMAVTEILILIPLVWLRRIVLRTIGGRRRDDRRALIEIERDVAFEMNRHRQIISSREVNRAATRRGCGVDRLIDCGRVKRLAVTSSTEGFDVIG